MKILQLSPQFPYPKTDGGKQSIAYQFETFNNLGIQTYLVSINKTKPELKYLSEAKEYGEVTVFQLDTNNRLSFALKNIVSQNSIYIEKHQSNQILESIFDLADRLSPDIVWADHSNMAWYAKKVSERIGIPFVLRQHNMEYLIWERYADDLRFGPMKLFIKWQAEKLKKDERQILKNASITFCITEEDRHKGLQLSATSDVRHMSVGVDKKCIEYRTVEPIYKKSLVIGTNYGWVHNVNGLEWFITNVLRKLVDTDKEINLNLIGKNIPTKLIEYDNVNQIGFVEDYADELVKYQIYIAPLMVGGGIRFKILEAMALGLPVIATSVSAEGIKAGERDGLFVSDSPEKQAEMIQTLLSDSKLLNESRNAAKAFIMANHNWKLIITRVVEQLRSISTT
jgi:glycosyltransferase involved in cell wall biosynthesis